MQCVQNVHNVRFRCRKRSLNVHSMFIEDHAGLSRLRCLDLESVKMFIAGLRSWRCLDENVKMFIDYGIGSRS